MSECIVKVSEVVNHCELVLPEMLLSALLDQRFTC